MDIAIVTGAENPLGQHLLKTLNQQGYRVHGIGNNLSKLTYGDKQFEGHAVDLTDLAATREVAEQILEKEGRVDLLVHALDVTPGTPFESLPVGNLEAVLKIALLGPALLTRLLLPNLKRFRGQIIQLVPTNKSGQPQSALNAMIEHAFRGLNQSIADDGRDSGLRMTNVLVHQGEALPPGTASDEQLAQSRIDPEDLGSLFDFLLDPHRSNLPAEIVLYPRLSPTAESALPGAPEPLDAYSNVQLPPKAYCPPEPEPIATKEPESVERSIPYTDEEMEERIAAAVEEYETGKVKPDRGAPSDPEGQGRKKKKRRRGRGRGKKKEGKEEGSSDSTQSELPSGSSEAAPKVKEETASPVPVKKAAKKKAPAKKATKKTAKKVAKKATKKTVKKAAKKKAAKKVVKKAAEDN